MPPSSEIRLWTSFLLARADEIIDVSEQVVGLCLNPVFLPSYNAPEQPPPGYTEFDVEDRELDAMYVVLLRTGAIFTVGGAKEALDSAWSGDAPEIGELPPLPFPRMVIEARDGDEPVPLLSFEFACEHEGCADDHESDHEHGLPVMDVLAIGLNERDRGELWDVTVVTGHADDGEVEIDESHFRLRASDGGCVVEESFAAISVLQTFGARFSENDVDGELEGWEQSRLAGVAITAAQLVTAGEQFTSEVSFPRAQRKDLVRRSSWASPPRVYFVDLDAVGEIEPGSGEREFHHRWLVRGHWRRNAHGENYIPAKGAVCVWVKAHVKGPPGAPWKGRPVHRRVLA